MAESAEIVIVGAGVMGASIAFHLAERRAGRILVLDQAYVAAGASGRSSGLVRMHYTHPPEVHMALQSLDYFNHWQERFDRPSSFRRTGFLVSRVLGNMGCSGSTPLLERFASPVAAGEGAGRWLEGFYLEQPEEFDDPYRFFGW